MSEAKQHIVQVGDSLRLIALRHYGPGGHEHWKTIYDANKETIGENPYIIRTGQVLVIPEVIRVPPIPKPADE